MAQLYPYLRFDGQCSEAMTFYRQCLGGELKFGIEWMLNYEKQPEA